MRAVDLFAGPGGWDVAADDLGLSVVGIEHDMAACRTGMAAGHRRVRADVSQYPAERFAGYEGLIASPPCQAFSAAGKRSGAEHVPALLSAVNARDWSFRPCADPKVWLVLEVGRWFEAVRPEWVALEQVPAVLPLWRAYAELMRQDGYSVQTAVLNAADFGVPQTRQRAVLIASRSRTATLPTPTHAERPTQVLFGESPSRWVSMAEALGWGMDDRPSFTVMAGGTETGGAEPFGRHAREMMMNTRQKSLKGGKRTEDYKRSADRPAPTVMVQAGNFWCWERPATTVVGSFCPEVIAAPGYRTEVSRQNAEGSVKVSLEDRLILQTFRPDYPLQGSKSKQDEQVGNAVPPLLALHVLRSVLP